MRRVARRRMKVLAQTTIVVVRGISCSKERGFNGKLRILNDFLQYFVEENSVKWKINTRRVKIYER